jgi:hypothetical protein
LAICPRACFLDHVILYIQEYGRLPSADQGTSLRAIKQEGEESYLARRINHLMYLMPQIFIISPASVQDTFPMYENASRHTDPLMLACMMTQQGAVMGLGKRAQQGPAKHVVEIAERRNHHSHILNEFTTHRAANIKLNSYKAIVTIAS